MPGSGPGARLHPYPVPVLDEGLDARRRQGDPVHARPGHPRDADVHGQAGRAVACIPRINASLLSQISPGLLRRAWRIAAWWVSSGKRLVAAWRAPRATMFLTRAAPMSF